MRVSSAALLLPVLCGVLVHVGCNGNSNDAADTLPPPIKHDGPSVLLITLDTTRADHLSSYGYSQRTSPYIDSVAAKGTLFSQAIAQASVTPVSHASILTGLQPYNHGLRVMHGRTENRLRDSAITLAEVLQRAGYSTAAFVSAFPVSERFGFKQGFDTFDADFGDVVTDQIVDAEGTVNTNKAQRRADATTDRALAWLKQAKRPFFLWLHYFDPHDDDMQPPAAYVAKYQQRTDSRIAHLKQLYDIEIRYMDSQIGRVFQALRRVGKPIDEMVVVVTADHGEGLGDHNWWSHGILYQEQIHVPLLVAGPSMPRGARREHLVRTIDIMPTVLELVGLPRSRFPRMDGSSLVPAYEGDTTDPGYTAYSDSVNMLTYQATQRFADKKDDMHFAIVRGPWKYIHHLLRSDESELYNLADDPGELKNLIHENPTKAAELLAELKARNYAPSGKTARGQMSPADARRLKSLGYLP